MLEYMIYSNKLNLITKHSMTDVISPQALGWREFWLHSDKQRFKCQQHYKLKPIKYGSYIITQQVGSNAIQLGQPLQLGIQYAVWVNTYVMSLRTCRKGCQSHIRRQPFHIFSLLWLMTLCLMFVPEPLDRSEAKCLSHQRLSRNYLT